jgi:hypothetical protein
MAISFTSTLKQNRANAIDSLVGANAKIVLYDGTPPTDAGTALSGNAVLATLTMTTAFAASTTNGVLQVNSIPSATVTTSGTASFFRVLKSDNTVVIQGSVGTSNSDLNLSTNILQANATVSITSFVLTESN